MTSGRPAAVAGRSRIGQGVELRACLDGPPSFLGQPGRSRSLRSLVASLSPAARGWRDDLRFAPAVRAVLDHRIEHALELETQRGSCLSLPPLRFSLSAFGHSARDRSSGGKVGQRHTPGPASGPGAARSLVGCDDRLCPSTSAWFAAGRRSGRPGVASKMRETTFDSDNHSGPP